MNRRNRLTALDLGDIRIEGSFFGRYMELVRETAIPYQWEVLNDRVEGVAASRCLDNFRAAAGISDEKYYGMVF